MIHTPPEHKIYHITHLRNLSLIANSGKLWSDQKRIELGLDCELVGMSTIKQRRLEELEVKCHPDTKVGQYVPFYFCPRSIMLYILHKGNHPELNYQGGQRSIIHLQADLTTTVKWAQDGGIRWAFSDRNAGAYFAEFFNRPIDLDKINWEAVGATDFRNILVKESKQAEFLVYESFPWTLVERIGVLNQETLESVEQALITRGHCPPVSIETSWYY